MSNQDASTEPQYPECRHIMPSGARCHSPALHGHPFCYFHARQRSLKEYNMYRLKSVALPPLEDRAAIQLAIGEILAAFADRKIDQRSASTYLYGIQMAMNNLALASPFPAQDPVDSVSPAAYGDELAPGAAGQEPDNPDTSRIRTCLREIDPSATHEYDPEPQPEPGKRTAKQQAAIDYLARNLGIATGHR